MEVVVNRLWPVPGVSTTGIFLVDGVQKYMTIERAPDDPLRISAGTYQLQPYPSPRFQSLLAQMRADYPSMAGIDDVPRLIGDAIAQRDPIEIHVANVASDVEGCIGIGLARTPDGHGILQSRDACADFYPKFMAAIANGETCSIAITDPQPVPGVEESIV